MARITAQNYQSYMKGSTRHIDTHTREMYLGDSPTVQAGYGTYDSTETAHKVACYMFSLDDSATASTPCEDIPRGFTVAIEENNTVVEYQYKKPMPLGGYTSSDLEVKGVSSVTANDVSYNSSISYDNGTIGKAIKDAAKDAIDALSDAATNAGDIGTISNLETSAKQDLVNAINEVNSKATNADAHVGDLSTLTTEHKTSTVAAINDVKAAIPTSMSSENITYNSSDNHTTGSIAKAMDTAEQSIISLDSDVHDLRDNVGNLSNLDTPKSNLVSAINDGITTAANSATAAAASSGAAQQASTSAVNAAQSVLDELDNFPASQDATVLQHGVRITALESTSVHDLSVMYSSSYANLTAALTALNADTSATAIKVAGMSIKFINSTTNKYEQWNLKASSWSTNASDWALDVDGSVTNDKLKLPFELEKPSSNEYVTQASQIGYWGSPVNEKLDPLIYGCYLNSSINASTGLIELSIGKVSTDFIPCTAGANAKLYNNGTEYNVSARYYNSNKEYLGFNSSVENKAYVRLVATISESTLNSVDENIYVILNGTTIYLNPSVVNNNNIERINNTLSIQAADLEQTKANLSRESATTKIIAINIDGKYVNKDTGYIGSITGFSVSERIYVKSGDIILYTGTVRGNACEVCLYYNNTFEVQTITNGRCTIAHDGYIVACSTTSSNGTVCIYNSRVDLTSINQSINTLQGEVTQLSALVDIVNINIDGYYIYATNGKVQALSGWSVSNRIDVKTGDIIIYNGYVKGNAAAICLYYNDTFEIPTITDGKCTISHDGYIIACSKNGNNGYVYIYNERVDGSSDAAKSAQTYINAEKVTEINIITSGVENKYIKIDTGALTAWNPSWGASYYATEDYIPVNMGDEWLFEGYAAGNAVAVAFYDKNKAYVSGASVQTSVYGTYRFVIPSGAVYMRVSSNIQYIAKPCVFRRTKFELDDKKWIVIGDSISTAYTVNQRHFYYDIIARAYKNCTTSVFAVAGSRMAYHTGATMSFVQRVETMIEEDTDKDANIITVFGGVNDWGQESTSTASSPIPLGTIDDALPADYTEATTFYKALKYLCNILIQNYPNAKIMFITPIGANPDSGVTSFANGTNSLGFTIMDYRNAMKEVCQTYGIEVSDVGGCSGITPIVASQKAAFFLTYAQDSLGGLHPNPDGHVKIAECVERDLI